MFLTNPEAASYKNKLYNHLPSIIQTIQEKQDLLDTDVVVREES